MLKRRVLCVSLCLILILSSAPAVLAAEEENILSITSAADLLTFAENCRLDSFSIGLTVQLCRDIDLTGIVFSGIPIFCGTFQGNGYTISGIKIDATGSYVGFFRHLSESAHVQDLNLSGTVAAKGSGASVGALAGSNAGRITACLFNGAVSGISGVGGLVGINEITGMIEESSVSGSVNGTHFVGGIAGENYGTIRYTHNRAEVNTRLSENQIELEDITLDSITSSESAATITDVGGICGRGTGVIRESTNHGNIGYTKIGYNIGGIAGSFSGYIFYCINYGTVSGRKDVGGILGQLEPAVHILYEEDTLQTLQQQLDTMSGLTGSAGAHAQGGSAALNSQAQKLEQQVKDAQDALDVLLPKDENAPPPDADEIQAAQNALSSSITGMSESFSSMVTISESTLSVLSQDIQSIAGQMNAIGGTIGTAADNLGGTITDASDLDTQNDRTSKVQSCLNNGAVSGDLNVGGIAGAIAFENDIDPDADIHLLGQSSFNFDMEVRAVILSCSNGATITAGKQNIGGIAGWMSLGLIKSSKNTGSVEASAASYAGGIAGFSNGYIRHCSVKSLISGSHNIGGISGLGSVVTDCRAMVSLIGVSEKSGAIIGSMENAELSGNYYLITDHDYGGVDGVSYEGKAQPLTPESFFDPINVPYTFHESTVSFRFEDHTVQVQVLYGETLKPDQIPDVPSKDGFDGMWSGSVALEDKIFFDTSFVPSYTPHEKTLQSSTLRSDGKPVFLIQGDFVPGAVIEASDFAKGPSIEAWELHLPESSIPMKLRYRVPDGYTADNLKLLTSADGDTWIEAPFLVEGSYLVLSAEQSHFIVRLELIPENHLLPLLAAVAGCVIITVLIVIIAKKKKKK